MVNHSELFLADIQWSPMQLIVATYYRGSEKMEMSGIDNVASKLENEKQKQKTKRSQFG